MSRFYENLGNLAPTWRLVVLAAVSCMAWLAGAQNEAWAGCGDYVKVANPRLGTVAHVITSFGAVDSPTVPSPSVPTLPCRGPHCGQGAPLAPLVPSPVVVQTLAEQFAVLALAANGAALDVSVPLAEGPVHPLAGYPSSLKRPPRA